MPPSQSRVTSSDKSNVQGTGGITCSEERAAWATYGHILSHARRLLDPQAVISQLTRILLHEYTSRFSWHSRS